LHDLLAILQIGLLLGGIYSLVSIGLTLIFGVVRIVNFAHGEILMIAMYATYTITTTTGLNPYAAGLLVVPACFVLGLVIQRLLIQPLLGEPMMQIFVTFGLIIFLENLVLMLTGGESMGIPASAGLRPFALLGHTINSGQAIALLAATAIAAALHLFLRHTMLGKAIRAVTQDKRAAATLGISITRTYAITFAIGTAITGLAGVLLTPIYTLSPNIGGGFVLAAFAVVVLGGLGSIWGAYLAGLIVGLVEALAGFYIDPALKSAVWFLIFFAVLAIRPSGLFGIVGAEEVGLREQH
jgi:branched-chain amino acid transport system permease protein